MSQRLKITVTAGLLMLCLAGWAIFLTRQGLAQADQWVTVLGFFVSTAIGAAGLVLGWLTWRQSTSPEAESVSAIGPGAVAIGQDNTGEISTEVSGYPYLNEGQPGGRRVSGSGSVAVGRDNRGPIRTRVTGTGSDTPPS